MGNCCEWSCECCCCGGKRQNGRHSFPVVGWDEVELVVMTVVAAVAVGCSNSE